MDRSIPHMLASSARKNPGQIALIFEDRQFSYQELDQLTNQFANALQALGIGSGDRVTLYAGNCWQWIVSYYGILKLGAVVNPLNMMLTPGEAEYAIRDCEAAAVIVAEDKATALAHCLGTDAVRHVISFGSPQPGILAFDALVGAGDASFDIPDIAPDELSTIAYTSGTTGHPKGAMLSHYAVLLNATMTAVMHSRNVADVVVSALPCAHVYGNIVMNSTFSCGGTLVLHPRFSEKTVLDSISRYRATLLEGVPTMYMYLLNYPELKEYDLSSLIRCTVGGQTMPVAKMEQVERAFKCPLIELWGMTELAGLGATHTLNGPCKHGSIGVPLPHVQIRIDAGPNARAPAPDPEVGELLVRGGLTMMGYYKNRPATDEVLTASGWLRTGDLGYIDADGFIFLVDRAKDLIITGGFNIYPAELERVIASHPAVAMVAVGGVKDELKGELANAYIVLASGQTASAEEIVEFCKERLAAYKVPRQIHFVTDLPKTSTGKIMRRALEKFAAHEASLRSAPG